MNNLLRGIAEIMEHTQAYAQAHVDPTAEWALCMSFRPDAQKSRGGEGAGPIGARAFQGRGAIARQALRQALRQGFF
ncbi:MAG: hypothetical protein FWG75_04540 [Cystobacterineae bacterium]|nr:hypothetical protein [Cystobacterineae bacterium]